MDTSKEYIKMCEKAVEIQPKLQPFHQLESEADLFHDYHDVWYMYVVDKKTKEWNIKKVWLPRQDQLQRMISNRGYKDFYWLKSYVLMMEEMKPDLKSMEQLWLAFVMKEKYNKTWNGKEWEVKDE